MEKNRNNIIDILRFFAACWVAVYHLNHPNFFPDNAYGSFIRLGYLGVPIFFVISGYCIAISIKDATTANQFLVRRFFRIFPTYWFSLALVVGVICINVFVHGSNSSAILPKNLTGILATLTLLTSPFSSVEPINWIYWTLTIEIIFYAIIYIYLIVPTSIRFYLLLLVSLLPIFLHHEKGALCFISYWPGFLLGFYLKQAQKNAYRFFDREILLLLTALIGIYYNPSKDYFNMALYATGIILLLNYYAPIKKNFAILGNFSYSIYLIHVPIGVYLLGYLRSMQLFKANLFLNIAFDFTVLLLVAFLAKLIYKKIEEPFILRGKKASDLLTFHKPL
ncbi:acyltransferase [Pedobacter sp. G11]|uniref:acyltransferase family protein n=1 Tax=Pedobacter sp. G11 TaxID=2482728 RepID=UPI000F602D60|nr:acyltransferase [Pedobacter sp. G11]AZI25843.1 acyltransferase [Pedobacter sp. G11]